MLHLKNLEVISGNEYSKSKHDSDVRWWLEMGKWRQVQSEISISERLDILKWN